MVNYYISDKGKSALGKTYELFLWLKIEFWLFDDYCMEDGDYNDLWLWRKYDHVDDVEDRFISVPSHWPEALRAPGYCLRSVDDGDGDGDGEKKGAEWPMFRHN